MLPDITEKAISIRHATEGDAVHLSKFFADLVGKLEIYNEAAKTAEIGKYDPAAICKKIDKDPMSISLAFKGKEIVGYCITTDQHGPIWINWYGVAEGERRAGIGDRLIRHLISELPSRHAHKIWCDTRINNTASIALFKKIGFHRICTLENHWYGHDFHLWELVPK